MLRVGEDGCMKHRTKGHIEKGRRLGVNVKVYRLSDRGLAWFCNDLCSV